MTGNVTSPTRFLEEKFKTQTPIMKLLTWGLHTIITQLKGSHSTNIGFTKPLAHIRFETDPYNKQAHVGFHNLLIILRIVLSARGRAWLLLQTVIARCMYSQLKERGSSSNKLDHSVQHFKS